MKKKKSYEKAYEKMGPIHAQQEIHRQHMDKIQVVQKDKRRKQKFY